MNALLACVTVSIALAQRYR